MRITHRYAAPLILLAGTLVAVAIALSGAFPAFAQEAEEEVDAAVAGAESSITFPVAELGSCENKQACKQYCNNPENIEACIAFAEAHGLMKKGEAEIAKKFARSVQAEGGPGDCTGPESCRTYCENIDHLEECLAFAEEHGHSDGNVEEGRKISKFLKSGGALPGGCNSRQSCEAYCSVADHMEECIAFAENAGLEIHEDDGRKVDIEHVKKMHALMKSRETPGGCQSKQECESFCQNPDNSEQCLAFAERVGFMPKEEIEMARKFMREGGPGGCRGREECESFCHNPENQEACMAFAEQNGMMRPEDARGMREMRSMINEGGHEGPGGPGISDCVRGKIQETMTSGQTPNMGMMQGVVKECMAQVGNPGQFGGEGFGDEGFRDDGFGEPHEGDDFEGEGFGGEGGMMREGQDRPMMPSRSKGMPQDPTMMLIDGEMHNRYEQYRDVMQRPGMQGDDNAARREEFERQHGSEFEEQYRQRYNEQIQQMMEQRGEGEQQIWRGGVPESHDGSMLNMPPQFDESMRMRFEQGMPPEGMMQMPPPTDMHMDMPPPPPPSDAPQSKSEMFNAMVANVLLAVFALYGAY